MARHNGMAAVAKDLLSEYSVEVDDWYSNHAKVEADDESVAMDAYNTIDPNGINPPEDTTPVEEYKVEWKSRTKFVCKRQD